MNTDILRVTLLQTDIAWEDKEQNLHFLRQQLDALRGTTDLIILPETFSTGFTSHVQSLAEPITAATIGTLQQWATQYDVALTGSFLACDDVQLHGEATHYYNRAFFLTPDGCTYYYDKRHLFRLGGEGHSFTAGSQRPVISYRSWNILLQVCYDLRFPVWSRNQNNEYDLLLYMANWPASRRRVWDILLPARAIENQCYVVAVNRVGKDPYCEYCGGSAVISPYGHTLAACADGQEECAGALIDMGELEAFRKKFPVLDDADEFSLTTDYTDLEY